MVSTSRRPEDGNDPAASLPSQRPWRLLWRALKWMFFAVAMVFIVEFGTAFVDGISAGFATARGLSPKPPMDDAVCAAYAAIALQAMLLWGALRGARAAASSLSAGLANRPVRRRGLVALFAVLILVWDAAAIGTLAWIIAHGGHAPVVPQDIARMPDSVGLAATHIALIALIAPVAEELFFRGWLWTALRKSWSPTGTLCCTSGLWLAMHVLDGTWRPLVLLPTGILLGLARHHGDSVRASLALHLMNNSIVVLGQLAAFAGSGAG